jgi:spermidine synthase
MRCTSCIPEHYDLAPMKMRINKLLDRALIPDNGGELVLYQRGEEFSIEVVGISGELMSTAIHGSEDALAELALERLKAPLNAHVVIGGLGMGFTLAAVLKRVGENGKVIVAELVPEVVKWNLELVGERSGHPLKDPRTMVHHGDVLELIRSGKGSYDAILLDTDNGPEGLTQPRNNRLYSHRGLRAAYDALRPGGVLAVWSTDPHEPFTRRLGMAGFRVEEIKAFAHRQKGTKHHLWFAKRP